MVRRIEQKRRSLIFVAFMSVCVCVCVCEWLLREKQKLDHEIQKRDTFIQRTNANQHNNNNKNKEKKNGEKKGTTLRALRTERSRSFRNASDRTTTKKVGGVAQAKKKVTTILCNTRLIWEQAGLAFVLVGGTILCFLLFFRLPVVLAVSVSHPLPLTLSPKKNGFLFVCLFVSF